MVKRAPQWPWGHFLIIVVSYHLVVFSALFILEGKNTPSSSQFIQQKMMESYARDYKEDSQQPGRDSNKLKPIKLLVFFPLFGLQKEKMNKKVHIEKYVIQAWTHMAQYIASTSEFPPGSSVRLINFVEKEEHCYPGFKKKTYSSYYNCQPLPQGCNHPEFDIPTMDCIFLEAVKLASPLELLFYASSDIIFPIDTLSAISSIKSNIPFPKTKKDFAIVGRRMEIETSKLPFTYSEDSLEKVIAYARNNGTLYSSYGLDYFIMPRESFPKDFPPFLLGRWRWDNALLTHFISEDIPTGFFHMLG